MNNIKYLILEKLSDTPSDMAELVLFGKCQNCQYSVSDFLNAIGELVEEEKIEKLPYRQGGSVRYRLKKKGDKNAVVKRRSFLVYLKSIFGRK